MHLIAGLGNPSKIYKNTYHNIGFLFLDFLTNDFKFNKKFNSLIKKTKLYQKDIILIKPLTFMNQSGEAIKKIQKYYKIPLPKILIIHDDIDLSIGEIKLSYSKSAAGHKGVESIIMKLDSKNFYRLRIGIHPKNNQKTKANELVLKKITLNDYKIFIKTFKKIQEGLYMYLTKGQDIAMNKINTEFFLYKKKTKNIKT